MDKILASNLLQYVKSRLEVHNDELLNLRVEYFQKKLKYEDKFFSRLFNLKFDNSSEMRFSIWSFDKNLIGKLVYKERRIKFLENEITRLEYHSKLGSLVELDTWEYSADKFYQFCKENGLP